MHQYTEVRSYYSLKEIVNTGSLEMRLKDAPIYGNLSLSRPYWGDLEIYSFGFIKLSLRSLWWAVCIGFLLLS